MNDAQTWEEHRPAVPPDIAYAALLQNVGAGGTAGAATYFLKPR